MVYGTYNELVTGANLNQLITGGGTLYGIPEVHVWRASKKSISQMEHARVPAHQDHQAPEIKNDKKLVDIMWCWLIPSGKR